MQTRRNIRLFSKHHGHHGRTLSGYSRSPKEGMVGAEELRQTEGKELTRWRKGKGVCSEECEKHQVEKQWIWCVHGTELSGIVASPRMVRGGMERQAGARPPWEGSLLLDFILWVWGWR